MPSKTALFGKSVILGDSYSTYEGYVPRAYPSYYTDGVHGLRRAADTWWGRLQQQTDMELLCNSSFSGSTIGGITYEGYLAGDTSFVRRYRHDLDVLAYDTLFIFGGTNDFWAGSPIGRPQYETCTQEDLLFTLPSLCCILQEARAHHPDARIVNLINYDLSAELVTGMQEICRHYGAECLWLSPFSRENGHPDVYGMEKIADEIMAFCR